MLNRFCFYVLIFLFGNVLLFEFSCGEDTSKQKKNLECLRYTTEAKRMMDNKQYDSIINIPSDAFGGDTSTVIRMLTYKAMAYYNLGKYQEAISYFNSLLVLEPLYAPSYEMRGLTYDNLKKYTDAFVDYSKALNLDSTLFLARNNRAQLYRKFNNDSDAILDFNFIIKYDSTQWESYNNRGLIYQKKGNTKLAIQDFEKGLSLDSNDILLYNLSTSEWKNGNLDLALKYINKAISLNSNDGVYFNNRGYYKAGLNDKAGACSDYHVAIAMKYPVDSEVIKYCK